MYLCSQGILATKDEELISCRDKIRELDGQSKAVEQTSNRATFTKMKKVFSEPCGHFWILLMTYSNSGHST